MFLPSAEHFATRGLGLALPEPGGRGLPVGPTGLGLEGLGGRLWGAGAERDGENG